MSNEAKAYFAGQSIEAPTVTPATPAPVGGGRISDAVARYLAKRGLGSAPAAPVADNTVTSVVDRFLAGRAVPVAPAPTPVQAPASAPPPVAPAPQVKVSPFVCEDDVRRARLKGEKIYVDSKTIITPAALDIGVANEILVHTE